VVVHHRAAGAAAIPEAARNLEAARSRVADNRVAADIIPHPESSDVHMDPGAIPAGTLAAEHRSSTPARGQAKQTNQRCGRTFQNPSPRRANV